MTKMTYAEQLKHPNWQRKRLEMLQAADWTCELCCAKEETLHVHHKHYVKGRMPWEYERAELVVLCEECHDTQHEVEAQAKHLLALLRVDGPASIWEAIALLAGFAEAEGIASASAFGQETPRLRTLGALAVELRVWLLGSHAEDLLAVLRGPNAMAFARDLQEITAKHMVKRLEAT